MGDWWERNEYGIWCNFCGDMMFAPHQFDSRDEFEEYEPGQCKSCGAPDEFDPEAV